MSDPFAKFMGYVSGKADALIDIEIAKRRPKAATPQPDNAATYSQNDTRGNYARSGDDAGLINTSKSGNVMVGGMAMSKVALTTTALLLGVAGAYRLVRG